MERETVKILAAILTTLEETEGHACAESTLYIACGMDLSAWNLIKGIMIQAGLIQVCRAHEVSLTAKGIDTARQVAAALAAAR